LAEDREKNGREPDDYSESLSDIQEGPIGDTKRFYKLFGKDSGDDRIRQVPDFLEPSRKPVLLLLARIYPLHSPADDSSDEFMRRKEMVLNKSE